MKVPKHLLAQTVIQLCKAKNIKHIVISPGSRSAPLTIGFTNHPFFKCYSIVDERSAAFFALGIAQQLQQPVALLCTSGSAMLNYYPAVAEAFYSDIPLVVLSADRPRHLIGIGEGQTINQNNVFVNHILDAVNLSTDYLKQSELEINKVLNTSIAQSGPVQINIPFDEPLYELADQYNIIPDSFAPKGAVKATEDWEAYRSVWNKAKRKMVLVGMRQPNQIEQKYLDILANDESVIVFTETISNMHHDQFFPSIDKIIASLTNAEFKALQPEVLLTFGGMVISKKIKAFLRKYPPAQHWHIDPKKANDSFFCLRKHFKCGVNTAFSKLLTEDSLVQSNYQRHWQKVKQHRLGQHEKYLKGISHSDLKVFDIILKSIPDGSSLQLGNSSTVRYVQLFDLRKTIKVFCNRGTSGIDGSTSTAVGAASVLSEQTVFITGDLSFFYDSNGLWNNYIKNNFRIIVINNRGGGIFRILPGHKDTDEFDTFFETRHNLSAKHLSDMFEFEYASASNDTELAEALKTFYTNNSKPKLLEIFTPPRLNDTILLNYFKDLV
jgi:2-succinyl-5-enolpyruvyl-6-hydroxy-3-cyclohexene-1-carboxylate synthase